MQCTMQYFSALLLSLPLAYAAQAPTFKPPSQGPTIPSPNFGSPSNHTLPKPTIVPGKFCDRFTQIWFENTDFETASSSAAFAALAKRGITLTNYLALNHPSEPNYVGASGGDYWGMGDDNLYNIPSNISTIVDLLEAKNISWAGYQESMATDGDGSFSEALPNYLNASAPQYTYYVRKHNPLIIYDSIATVPERAALVRNFNDFAADVNASSIPQWLFITPNLVDDAHDTTVDFAGQWIDFWLNPLLSNPHFNDNRTLILVSFDENETSEENNRVFSVLLGGVIPAHLRGTTDDTLYTHYSTLSSVQANWGLGCLGRNDANKTVSNVFDVIANVTGYKNMNVTSSSVPFTNGSGTTPGPLNPNLFVPFSPPDANAQCAGGGSVFISPGMNTSFGPLPPPVNLTALNETLPSSGPVNASATAPGAPAATATKPPSGGAGREVACVAASAFGAVLALVELCV